MRIAEPGRIGKLRLKNRIVAAPMGTNFGTGDGYASERDRFYYAERARGGVALIITEAMSVSATARNHTQSLGVFHDSFVPGLAQLVRAIHEHGALAVAQLNHRGGLLRRKVKAADPVGPSPWTNPQTGEPVRELSRHEIGVIRGQFKAAARRVVAAGYDGAELHAANGYLFHQFLSPRVNRRTDEYGGSLANRMRLLLETTEEIQSVLQGRELLVRLSVSEFADGGFGPDEVSEVVRELEKLGVASIDFSGGSNEHPSLSCHCIQPMSYPHNYLAPFVSGLRAATRLPVILAGRVVTPEDAEALLESGAADFVALGRALLADAHWVRKALSGGDVPIRYCIGCNVCYERLTREQDVSCVQNPLVGTEFEAPEWCEPTPSQPPGGRRRFLVIGAGVAGIEAARVLAGFGHAVEVWEREGQPRGQVGLAVVPPHKQEVEPVWTYRWEQVKRLGVKVRVRMEVSEAALRRYDPDYVVVATGARPRKLNLPTDESVPLLDAWDVLRDGDGARARALARVTIIGGGMVGVETAELLASHGVKVHILEMLDVVAKELPRNNRWDTLQRLEGAGVTYVTEAKVTGLSQGRITYRVGDRELAAEAGDAVIVAVGAVPERSVTVLLDALGLPYVLVGDCHQPGDFLTSIRDACLCAIALGSGIAQGSAALAKEGMRRVED